MTTYKGFIIEFNQNSKRGFDYYFFNEQDTISGYGRSVSNCKNKIDLILIEQSYSTKQWQKK